MDILSRELTKVRLAFCYKVNNSEMSIFMQMSTDLSEILIIRFIRLCNCACRELLLLIIKNVK